MWLSISIAVIVFIILLIYILKSEKKKKTNKEQEVGLLINNTENSFPTIEIVENKNLIPDEKNRIKDIDIKKAISSIDNIVPNTAMIGNNTKNSTELLNSNRAFFSASKKGTENMMKVKGTNELYGTQVIGGKFNKQTKFVNENQMIKNAGKGALVNAGFNMASMVVGQYYMNEINNKLDDLKEDVNLISDYLDSDYKSRIAYIVSKLKEVIENKSEILSSEFSMNKRYDDILELESDCSKLLGQANEMIKNNIKEVNIDYRKYEKQLKQVHKWFLRQQILQTLLLEIGNLRYVLSNGNETSKLSHTQYNNYLLQCNNVNNELEKWHNSVGKKLGVDIMVARRNGKFFKVKKNTIGKINEEWAYNKINENIVELIKSQTNVAKLEPYINKKQDEIIKIQRYNGEYYNLIEEKNK